MIQYIVIPHVYVTMATQNISLENIKSAIMIKLLMIFCCIELLSLKITNNCLKRRKLLISDLYIISKTYKGTTSKTFIPLQTRTMNGIHFLFNVTYFFSWSLHNYLYLNLFIQLCIVIQS